MKNCLYCMKLLNDEANFCPACGKDQTVQPPQHHLPPGTILKRKYLLGAALGEGGFGVTYAGLDTALNLRVAIKEFFPAGFVTRVGTVSTSVTEIGDREKTEFFKKGKVRLIEEARVLAKFSGSRGIVDVRDFFEENNTAYIVMEFVDGVTLKQYLNDNGALSPEDTLRLFTPVMESLRLLHKEKVIHRDISPDNIMLTDGLKGEVKLLDFGAARSVGNDQKSLSVMLKPGFAPEEQYRSKGKQGPWTDVYALCATMYRCITGVRPDESPDRLDNDTLQAPSAMGVKIDPGVEAVILKGLELKAKDRWQSMDELLAELTHRRKTLEEAEKERLERERRAAMEKEIEDRVKREYSEKEAARKLAEQKAMEEKAKKEAAEREQLLKAQAEENRKKKDVPRPPEEPDVTQTVVAPKRPPETPRGPIPTVDPEGKKNRKNGVTVTLGIIVAVLTVGILVLFFLLIQKTADSEKKGTDDETTQTATDDAAAVPNYGDRETLFFGTYEQDNDTADGAEEIEWLVLEKKGNRALVISKYALDCQVYNKEFSSVTWETCRLRQWLNDDFYNAAFTASEQSQIVGTTVTANKNPPYNTDPGNNTTDKVFLLSIEEAEQYFTEDADRKCAPTAYAETQGSFTSSSYLSSDGKATCYWWLRSPGASPYGATNVLTGGHISTYGNVCYTENGVRPALWLNLEP